MLRYVFFLFVCFDIITFSYAAEDVKFYVENATSRDNYSYEYYKDSDEGLWRCVCNDFTVRVTLSPGHKDIDWIRNHAGEVNKISIPTQNGAVSIKLPITDPDNKTCKVTDISAYITCSFIDTNMWNSEKKKSGRRFLGVSSLSIPSQNLESVGVRFKEMVSEDKIYKPIVDFDINSEKSSIQNNIVFHHYYEQ